jgi:hypothetical protein
MLEINGDENGGDENVMVCVFGSDGRCVGSE